MSGSNLGNTLAACAGGTVGGRGRGMELSVLQDVQHRARTALPTHGSLHPLLPATQSSSGWIATPAHVQILTLEPISVTLCGNAVSADVIFKDLKGGVYPGFWK